MSALRAATLRVLSASLAVAATPALAADRSTLSVYAERLAMALPMLGGFIFFAWVAWLAFRR
jgi:hypothetical protein